MNQSNHWSVAVKIPGELQAEIIRGLLESQGIPVYLAVEGAARAIGINVGPFGMVDVMVPEDHVDEAQEVIAAYQAGDFEAPGG